MFFFLCNWISKSEFDDVSASFVLEWRLFYFDNCGIITSACCIICSSILSFV